MRTVLCFFIFFLTPFISIGQTNLVPNGDFEDSIICNNGWTMPNLWFPPTNGSPDYIGVYDTTGCTLTQSFWGGGQFPFYCGYQWPHSGTHYTGFECDASGGREYMEVKLIDSLIAGKKYCLNFYVSLADNAGFASDGIGVGFDHDSTPYYQYDITEISTLNFVAGNAVGNPLNDTMNWTLVTDTFIAVGGERFMILGNVRPNAQTNFTVASGPYGNAYYYVDDVSLLDLGYTGINENSNVYHVSVIPNPSNGAFQISGNFPAPSELHLYDLLGNEIVSPVFISQGEQTISLLLNLRAGAYFYRIISEGNFLAEDRLIITNH